MGSKVIEDDRIDWKQNQQTLNPWQDLQPKNESQKLALRRLCQLWQNGSQISGVSPDCGPDRGPPSWYDPTKFQRAQRLHQSYGAIINLAQFYGLLFSLRMFHQLAPLLSTGNSRTLSRLYTRYLSTIIHVRTWFRYDPFDLDGRAYLSLKIVRALHQEVGNQLNAKSRVKTVWISQQAMCNAQFAFVGFMAVFPVELGFHCFTREDFDAMFHFWRVIGYCLGIEDQYNLCTGSDDEIVKMCRLIFDKIWLPTIVDKTAEPIGVDMARSIATVLSRINFALNYNALIHYFMRHALRFEHSSSLAKSDVRNIGSLNGFVDWTIYCILYCVFQTLSRYSFVCWLLTCVDRFLIWLAILRHNGNVRYFNKSPYSDVRYEIDQRCPFSVFVTYFDAIWLELH